MATNTAIIDADTGLSAVSLRSHSHPSKDAGTTIARMVLSAEADTSSVADGLNFSAVGGNECACRILSNGYDMISQRSQLETLTANVFASRIPILRSAHPYDSSLPSELLDQLGNLCEKPT